MESSELPTPTTTSESDVEAVTPPESGPGDGLARTGAQVRELLAIGGVLTVLGALFLITRRREN